MDFLKKHAKQISNLLVFLAVIIAIFVKLDEDGSDAFFKENDLYIFAGIALIFLLFSFFSRFKKK